SSVVGASVPSRLANPASHSCAFIPGRIPCGRHASAPAMTFLEDGQAALEWAAAYLERVGELPVLSPVAPGDIRAALPASPPEDGEPFAAVLRDLDEILLPGVTHWQHPRNFAYF